MAIQFSETDQQIPQKKPMVKIISLDFSGLTSDVYVCTYKWFDLIDSKG